MPRYISISSDNLSRLLDMAQSYGLVERIVKRGCQTIRSWRLIEAHSVDAAGELHRNLLSKARGWLRTRDWKFHTKEMVKVNTLRDWPMQTIGAEITQLAICLCFDNGVEVITPVHDAIMIQAPISEMEAKVKIARKCMEDASEYVLGFRIRTDVKTVRYSEHYSDPRGDWMWNKVWEILDGMDPNKLQA